MSIKACSVRGHGVPDLPLTLFEEEEKFYLEIEIEKENGSKFIRKVIVTEKTFEKLSEFFGYVNHLGEYC